MVTTHLPIIHETLVIRTATRRDLPTVARVHSSAFAGFFMTRLGQAFLREYYRLTLEGPGGILLVAEKQGEVVGFVAGFTDPECFLTFMRTQKLRLAWTILGRIILSPSLIPRLMLNFGRVQEGREIVKPFPGVIAELASIGVEPTGKGKGVGRQLISDFLCNVAASGARSVTLLTDAHENERTNSFYVKLGFSFIESFTQADGRVMNAYGCKIDEHGEIVL